MRVTGSGYDPSRRRQRGSWGAWLPEELWILPSKCPWPGPPAHTQPWPCGISGLLITDAKTQPRWVRRQIQITSLGKKETVSNITDNNSNPSEESYYWCMITSVVELKPCTEIWFFAFSKKSVWRKKWGEWPQIKRSQVTTVLRFLTHHVDGLLISHKCNPESLHVVFFQAESGLL